jgi:hypothetical protein
MSVPAFIGVYSARNADRVRAAVEPARRAGWEIALKALDEPPPDLAPVTRAQGTGKRLANLNEMLALVGWSERWVVLCDDDVEFVRGNVVSLVDEASAARLGIAQPAHAPGSHVSHPHTRAVRRSRARSVPYVEAGPVSAISPAWTERVFPLPAWRGMGWGLELEWMDLRADGCVLGVVDRVAYLHLDPVGSTYDEDPERRQMAADLAERGITDLRSAQVTLDTWRPWQRRPPWSRP